MAFLALFIAANIWMLALSWRVHRGFLNRRGRDSAWGFQNAVHFFLIWSLVGGFFNIGFFHALTLGVFLFQILQLTLFLGLIKLGTMEYNFACCKRTEETA
jgi:hypothetical protein